MADGDDSADGEWMLFSTIVRNAPDGAAAAVRRLLQDIADGQWRYRYRYPEDPPSHRRYEQLPAGFFHWGTVDLQWGLPFSAVSFNRRTIIELELLAAEPPEPAAGRQPAPASEPAIRSNREWFELVAMKSIPPDHRKHGWKRTYAQKLELALAEAAKTNPKLKPQPWTSILTRLGEIGWSKVTTN